VRVAEFRHASGVNIPIAKRIKGALGHAAGVAGVFARAFRSKTIIMAFHRVRDDMPQDGMTCGSVTFENFCGFFRTHFRVVPLSEQVAGCSAGKDMGGTLSITLDDGYRDNFEVAAPILRKMSLPAAFFVTTGFIGTRTVAPWDRDLVRQPGWMDWDQVRSLAAQGFEIGCHTDTHVDMGTADAETVRAELEASRRKLQEQLSMPTRLFAYPFGGRNNICERSLMLVREAGFVCCLSCFGGSNPPSASPFNLGRIAWGTGFVSPDQFGFDLLIGRI
jgi:peptidoglycan/xylan/chitin deacetylase (PgdA/CDA1 family)